MQIVIKKPVSEFVKRQRELNARIVDKLAWDSRSINGKQKVPGTTYIRSKHGELK